uniref:SWIM-type zinc finger 7 associated protein 1 n=1 Tax=Sinocyclocheilus anshuiensis TaxID=1608454 RepID=A0A671T9K8_9TELE
MADILGVVFRRFASGTVTSDVIFPPDAEANTLVLGDVNISRSVLFLAAVTAATDLGLKVLFFTQTPFQSLPSNTFFFMHVHLQNVKLVYVKTLEELVEDIASLHELASPPSLIIVDGLDHYLHRSRVRPLQDDLSPVAHVAALLHDTAAFLSQILQNRADGQGLCRVMVSFQSECEGSRDSEALAPELLLCVLDRYLQVSGGGICQSCVLRWYSSGTWCCWQEVLWSSGSFHTKNGITNLPWLVVHKFNTFGLTFRIKNT